MKKAHNICNSLENSLYSVVVFDHVLTHIDQIKVSQWLIVFYFVLFWLSFYVWIHGLYLWFKLLFKYS